MELSEEIKVSKYTTFKKYLKNLIGENTLEPLFSLITGGEEGLMNASFGMNEESGTAYDGSLVKTCIEIAEYAVKINSLLPEDKRVKDAAIYKVALLQHIAKANMYTKNDNEWEIKNRGLRYKFVDSEASLRCGERSVLIAMTAGVKFTEEEFEAMRVVDKVNEGDNAVRWYGTVLSTVIRQANELISTIYKQ